MQTNLEKKRDTQRFFIHFQNAIIIRSKIVREVLLFDRRVNNDCVLKNSLKKKD